MIANILDHFRRRMGYAMPRTGPLGFFLYWRLVPDRIESELVPGIYINMDLRDKVQKETYWHGGRTEPHLRRDLLELCSTGVTNFFDIGANFGFYSYYLLSHVPSLAVHAFEPGERYPAQMQETKQRNQLDRFHIHRMGLSDQRGVLELLVDPINSGNSSFAAGHPNRLPGSQPIPQKVPIMTFDDWIEEQSIEKPGAPSWVAKVDVEGFELKVLKGMRNSLEQGLFKAIAVEVFARTLALAGARPADIFQYMESVDYTAYDEASRTPTHPIPDDENRNVVFLKNGLHIPGYAIKESLEKSG